MWLVFERTDGEDSGPANLPLSSMAKVRLNSTLVQLQGAIGGLVIRHTPHGDVLSRSPDMSRVKWSAAQLAQRKRMKAAAQHYRRLMAEPAKAARYVARAAKLRIPVSSLVMGEFLSGKRTGSSSGVRND